MRLSPCRVFPPASHRLLQVNFSHSSSFLLALVLLFHTSVCLYLPPSASVLGRKLCLHSLRPCPNPTPDDSQLREQLIRFSTPPAVGASTTSTHRRPVGPTSPTKRAKKDSPPVLVLPQAQSGTSPVYLRVDDSSATSRHEMWSGPSSSRGLCEPATPPTGDNKHASPERLAHACPADP
jgi:hypothetical protein